MKGQYILKIMNILTYPSTLSFHSLLNLSQPKRKGKQHALRTTKHNAVICSTGKITVKKNHFGPVCYSAPLEGKKHRSYLLTAYSIKTLVEHLKDLNYSIFYYTYKRSGNDIESIQ